MGLLDHTEIPNTLFTDYLALLTHDELTAVWYVLRHTNGAGAAETTIDQKHMAMTLAVTESQVDNILTELEKARVLIVGMNGKRLTYRVNLPAPDPDNSKNPHTRLTNRAAA